MTMTMTMTTQKRLRSPATLMIVDDDPRACQLFAKILREEGYQVVTATGGAQAVALAAEAKPQLILLDIVMPELDGIATLRELRRHNHVCPVIMLTVQGTLQTARAAMILGAYDYITKPFDLELLKSVIRDGLRSHLPEERRERACAL
jgi:DNA-binding response OmpR family regulator